MHYAAQFESILSKRGSPLDFHAPGAISNSVGMPENENSSSELNSTRSAAQSSNNVGKELVFKEYKANPQSQRNAINNARVKVTADSADNNRKALDGLQNGDLNVIGKNSHVAGINWINTFFYSDDLLFARGA